MRTLGFIFCTLFIFGAISAPAVHAYYDDSVVIEIGDIPPPQPPPPDDDSNGNSGGTWTGGSGAGIVGNGSSGNGGSSSAGGNTYGNETGNGNGSGNASSTEVSSDGETQGSVTGSLYDELVAQGAISGGSQSSSSSTNTASSSSNSIAGTGGGSSGGGDTVINAAKLRAALRKNTGFRQILDTFSAAFQTGSYRRGLSEIDVGLIGASAVLEDTNIDELTFGATKFEMVYRSRGYLLGIIPKSFPVRIMVNPQASIARERVALSMPWYRFLIRKLFKPSELARDIDALVTADVRAEGDTAGDVQARLFTVVSDVLKKKIGTIAVDK